MSDREQRMRVIRGRISLADGAAKSSALAPWPVLYAEDVAYLLGLLGKVMGPTFQWVNSDDVQEQRFCQHCGKPLLEEERHLPEPLRVAKEDAVCALNEAVRHDSPSAVDQRFLLLLSDRYDHGTAIRAADDSLWMMVTSSARRDDQWLTDMKCIGASKVAQADSVPSDPGDEDDDIVVMGGIVVKDELLARMLRRTDTTETCTCPSLLSGHLPGCPLARG